MGQRADLSVAEAFQPGRLSRAASRLSRPRCGRQSLGAQEHALASHQRPRRMAGPLAFHPHRQRARAAAPVLAPPAF